MPFYFLSRTEALMKSRNKKAVIIILLILTAAMSAVCLLTGPSDMTAAECLSALTGKGTPAAVRIVRNIRIPRVLAAVIAGAGLSAAGHIMQTVLNNSMASPSTLGVSNAAAFGANLSIIAFSGGFLTGKNLEDYISVMNPFSTSLTAFVFSAASALAVLGLCGSRAFSPDAVVLSGIAIGSVWTAATSVLQFYATDVGISAAVVWSFGDLGRASYRADGIMAAVAFAGIFFFLLVSWKYNAMLSGDEAAKSMGVNVPLLRFVSLLAASLITAVCVSFLGIIGFIGIICPHTAKKLLGNDHRYSVPASALCGSLLLLTADAASGIVGEGSALPIGAVTSLLGAPFFIALIFSEKRRKPC